MSNLMQFQSNDFELTEHIITFDNGTKIQIKK